MRKSSTRKYIQSRITPGAQNEILILRELEGMSYREIADLAGIRVGTVMSRLARGRERLQQQLTHPVKKEP